MKIVQERIDREEYLELSLSDKELQHLKEYMIISRPFCIDGKVTNIGIKLDLCSGEEYDSDDQ